LEQIFIDLTHKDITKQETKQKLTALTS